jgi:hypothetical protein
MEPRLLSSATLSSGNRPERTAAVAQESSRTGWNVIKTSLDSLLADLVVAHLERVEATARGGLDSGAVPPVEVVHDSLGARRWWTDSRRRQSSMRRRGTIAAAAQIVGLPFVEKATLGEKHGAGGRHYAWSQRARGCASSRLSVGPDRERLCEPNVSRGRNSARRRAAHGLPDARRHGALRVQAGTRARSNTSVSSYRRCPPAECCQYRGQLHW